MKIILYGGAFNPVHTEHVALARAAVKSLSPDKLFIIPTAISPHKSGCMVADDEDRLEMLRQAFADVPCAEVCDFEIKSGGISYSYITCSHFRELYPQAEIYFLMGADMLASFDKWKYPEKILSCANLIAGAREDGEKFSDYKKSIEKLYGVHVHSVDYVGKKVSSTRIRTLAALGEDFSEYVLPCTRQYIINKDLYALKNLQEAKNLEKPSRWAHSVRVAVMCAQNASRAGWAEKQAITAGALHDVAKNLPKDSPYLEGFVPPEGVPSPVMHQFSGEFVARTHFKIEDKSILNAIKYHCSGRAAMSEGEMLLYLCDMLEEAHDFDGIEKLRREFKKDLKGGMLAALGHQVKYLNSVGGEIYNLTEQAYLYLKENLT